MSLWRHRDFLKLWIGETVSVLGSQVTQLALPLAAAVMLHATPVQMGILGAADTAPFLLIALFAGAWVDRMHRRRVMIVADFGRALLLGVVPVAYLAGWLSLELL
ncbi:MAG: MFS transporter, partial [Clostridia bacterium]|nr:MFS transporter [Clostridia bacterium]